MGYCRLQYAVTISRLQNSVTSVSAEATQVASEELETEHNGRDVETLEPITHDYDKVGQLVISECTAWATTTGFRPSSTGTVTSAGAKSHISSANPDRWHLGSNPGRGI